MKTYVVTPHYNRLDETVLMVGHKICFYGKIWLIIPKLSLSLGSKSEIRDVMACDEPPCLGLFSLPSILNSYMILLRQKIAKFCRCKFCCLLFGA